MKQYKLVNNLVGWFAFLVAAITYCSTVEPTASFWDCPEFITTGYKLEVGHPPGAPFFMLVANFFSQFASDATQVAYWVNIMNALMSAGCILFLFWSITHLVKKLVCPDDEQMNFSKMLTIMGSGLVGALAYTWSDTFWFSAVEGEVYAFSSLFTAVVFWLILTVSALSVRRNILYRRHRLNADALFKVSLYAVFVKICFVLKSSFFGLIFQHNGQPCVADRLFFYRFQRKRHLNHLRY